jgi:bifunctional UDP-N-acetylglucosamine pyrophosphorylase/glucosamine-1-phosphate N-acetyltransferase
MATTDLALDIVIMAAGKGIRMRSKLPKVLHRLAGRSLLQHVLQTAAGLGARRIIVITGHGAELVEASCAQTSAVFARQEPQHGTGHAVQQAVAWLGDGGTTLILNGDVPLIEAATAKALVAASEGSRLALLTAVLDDPRGYGRIVRGDPAGRDALEGGRIHRIVEDKDATAGDRSIREIYTGVMAAPTRDLKRWLAALRNDNAQREYYLTDVVQAAVDDGIAVVATHPRDPVEVMGVNSGNQLAELERLVQRRHADALMERGVRLADPARFDLRGELVCGADVEIDVGCIFEGRVELGDDVTVGAHCVLRNATVGAGVTIRPYTHIDGGNVGVKIAGGAEIGPFARLRAGADLGSNVHVGNFVEIKNARLGDGAKANHLAYLGDAQVGERVNFGAGSITANYDGANKHRTTIGADAHIGSNCVLGAPVVIGAGATIGGGSTINKDAPAGELTVARARQATIRGWKRPVKR